MKTATDYRIERYQTALRSIPAPGAGCHAALLSVANLGMLASVPEHQLLTDIRGAIPHGARHVTDREIIDAIRKACADVTPGAGGTFRPYPLPRPTAPPFDPQRALVAIVAKGGGTLDEMDVLDNPQNTGMAITWPIWEDAARLLTSLYAPDEYVYIGNRLEANEGQARSVRPAADWAAFFQRCTDKLATLPEADQSHALDILGERFPHICANPLTGQTGTTKTGAPSFRADDCVAAFRFAVVEFDMLPRPAQLAFFRGIGMPISALIDSGGKSIHAWVRLDARDRAEWETVVEQRLFDGLLRPLGVDTACRNESRLSRLPGVGRAGKRALQRLLFLCPQGGRI